MEPSLAPSCPPPVDVEVVVVVEVEVCAVVVVSVDVPVFSELAAICPDAAGNGCPARSSDCSASVKTPANCWDSTRSGRTASSSKSALTARASRRISARNLRLACHAAVVDCSAVAAAG